MNIPEEAVEAAREAVRAAMIEFGPDGHTDGDEEITRAALESAGPHLMARAWDEGYKAAMFDKEFYSFNPNPYRSAGAGG